jgi:hypothetical protein
MLKRWSIRGILRACRIPLLKKFIDSCPVGLKPVTFREKRHYASAPESTITSRINYYMWISQLIVSSRPVRVSPGTHISFITISLLARITARRSSRFSYCNLELGWQEQRLKPEMNSGKASTRRQTRLRRWLFPGDPQKVSDPIAGSAFRIRRATSEELSVPTRGY